MPDQIQPSPQLVTSAAGIPGADLMPVFANKFAMFANPQYIRIMIGNVVVGDQERDAVYHSAIVVPIQDAVGLANAILGVHQRVQEEVAKAQGISNVQS
jgi:hypothetical protein